MNTPLFLTPGSTIGITAPSFGATTEPYASRFNEAVKAFTERGYTVIPGRTCFKNDGIGISTDPETAARELVHFYKNPAIQAIISCGGGECMCETVGYIDFNELKNVPAKWFMGYSDNTNFIFPLVTISGAKAIYGPCFTTFGKKWDISDEDAVLLLEGKKTEFHGYPEYQSPEADQSNPDPFGKYIMDCKKILTSWLCNEGKAEKAAENQEILLKGTLLGGCLDVLNNLAGTKLDNMQEFNQNHQDIIWVLEACDYSPMDIRRSLWHLDNCGWFKNAKGFVFGRPLASYKKSVMGVDQYKAVLDMLSKYNVPIIMDADVGHIDPTVPLIIGAETEVKVQGNNITFKF